MPKHVIVIGSSGKIGGLFARTLAGTGATLTGIDVVEPPLTTHLDTFLMTDITAPSADAAHVLARAEWVFVCLPEESALRALPFVTESLPPGALWVDTLSVKQQVCDALMYIARVESVSINPLFAPDLGFSNQNVAVVQASPPGPRATAFMQWLETVGARIVTLSAAAHDRYSATTQVATHALLLAFGMLLEAADYDVGVALKVSTPPHRLLLSLLHRVTSGDPDLYWSIQQSHSLGPDVRQSLIHAITALDRMVAAGDAGTFVSTFERLRARLAAAGQALEPITRAALEAVSR